MSPRQALRAAADGLANHPHDHGWRHLYLLFLYGLTNSAPRLTRALVDSYVARPVSATHLLTLLGIALKAEAGGKLLYLASEAPLDERLASLEEILTQRSSGISRVLFSRQNSFTCARRFLVPRVILNAFFSRADGGVRFADLGTGLGVLPRQLNSSSQYEAYAADLMWPDGIPAFERMKIESIFGVDRPPMPNAEWVRACYGPSDYYVALYNELEQSFNDPQVKQANVIYQEIDLLDKSALTSFIRQNRINAVNLSYVLYELETDKRQQVIDVLTKELETPGIVVVTEPREELHREGCVVEVFINGTEEPAVVCFVSDGHFTGYVIPLDDYHDFVSRYPIAYRRPTRG